MSVRCCAFLLNEGNGGWICPVSIVIYQLSVPGQYERLVGRELRCDTSQDTVKVSAEQMLH